MFVAELSIVNVIELMDFVAWQGSGRRGHRAGLRQRYVLPFDIEDFQFVNARLAARRVVDGKPNRFRQRRLEVLYVQFEVDGITSPVRCRFRPTRAKFRDLDVECFSL